MQPCGYGLEEEARSGEQRGVRAFPEFGGGEAVAVGGEGGYDMGQGVGGGEPGGGVEVGFYEGELGVEGFGEEEVGAGEEVFEEALRGLEGDGGSVGWDGMELRWDGVGMGWSWDGLELRWSEIGMV